MSRWLSATCALLVILVICESFTLDHGTSSIIRRAACRQTTRSRPIATSRLFLVEDDEPVQVLFGGSDFDSLESTQEASDLSQNIFKSLKARQKEITLGIGKRFRTRTQKGFLNVHYEPTDPYDTSNIVNQLEEGQIVTSTGPARGLWIKHDGGGWSISKFGGFTWLEPINE